MMVGNPVALGTVTGASGIGLATLTADGTVLDTWFPDPELGDFDLPGNVRLTAADAELDRVLAAVTHQRQEDETQARMLAQALSTAQTRVQSVSDYIDTRRGSIGPEARTRLAEAKRQLYYTARPVSEIAYELGFDDAAYFTRFFTRRAGISPRAFRARGPQA